MILDAGVGLEGSVVLENGCGVGMYVEHMAPHVGRVVGLEFDFERAQDANRVSQTLSNAQILCAAGEGLPFPDGAFDLILSHEVLEHVQNDREAVHEMVRTLRPGGRIVIFAPNRGYPFETHGILEKLFVGLPVKFIRRTVIFGAYDNIIARRAGIGKALREVLLLLEKTPLRVLGLSHFWVVEKL
jgi:SAM-dependent methyltransferase